MFDLVIFDFDGTLADTSRGVFGGIKYALAALGEPVPGEEILRRFIGPPIEASFSEECALNGEQCALAVKKYREYYSKEGMFELEFYPSAFAALKTLRERGVKIGIGSSKPEPFINKILEHYGVRELFDCVCGASLEHAHTDKCGIILNALSGLGCTCKSRAVMVGDRRFDVEGAHCAGIRCIGVLEGGFGSREEFEHARADYIVPTLAQVPDIVERGLGG